MEEEDFEEVTLREAADVQRLMEESDGAMQDAQAFTQTLHANLASLDQVTTKYAYASFTSINSYTY